MTLPQNAITADLSTAVLAAMTRAAETEILPRWRSLAASEIRTKAHDWDLVTDADVEAEKQLTVALRDILDVTVVGEEATAVNPALLDEVGTGEPCWVVDPVDGTRNFVHGEETFACMVALIDGGRTQAAWITYPTTGSEVHAARGVGAFLDGQRHVAPAPPRPEALRGAVSAVYTGKGADDALLERAGTLGPASPIRFCAGWDYLDIVTGQTDYTSFTRTLPWDHAPGALIVSEAGLRVARFDGSEYLPGDKRTGILTAHPSVWQRVSDALAQ
ncbi:inositol monophosphatase [Demequina sp. TTPB684]|uniref:inositol monophosphatase family protein n=1 Tax=unclassified Demequina TaxID=2620311 RepID=UPI001CF16B14|nr:inositol monophosphatase family protein [Demequina sp. TMPB413]MCB2412851.1 inositol monophosphatase [Demequina sp. TTPB684]UPU87519.1 inositol monophosphatase [Demequina sp. TMPB413]